MWLRWRGSDDKGSRDGYERRTHWALALLQVAMTRNVGVEAQGLMADPAVKHLKRSVFD